MSFLSLYMENPFPVTGYYGPGLFCDRVEETARLVSNAHNGINTTLLAIRRMGKTGLIHHAFDAMQARTQCIYVDIYATQNIRDFTNQLAAGILKAFPEKKSIGKQFMILLKSLRPVMSFDPLSGQPEVSFEFTNPRQYQASVESLFGFLEAQQKRVLIAIDEFQQVSMYPEKNTEAWLRTLIHPLKNVRFIFSGSNRHMLTQIFNNSSRPFFSSTQTLYLAEISHANYAEFIADRFRKHKRKINPDALQFLLDWTRRHTYYTQVVCNRVFASNEKNITRSHVQKLCATLLDEQETIFLQYRNLLTSAQWNLLRAIAREDKVYQVTGKNFIRAHPIGTASNIQRVIEALLTKEMVYREKDENGNYYRVYDCFLARWLENN
jgi:uncharacterized protein